MGKTAFVFPGQGAQASGMWAELYKSHATAKEIFGWAEALRPGTKEQCFSADINELSITANTQPCLFVAELAIAEALHEEGIEADMTAGFSLGELSALCYAYMRGADESAFSLIETNNENKSILKEKDNIFSNILELVIKRAELMQESAEKNPASMAAVLKLSNDKAEELCRKFEKVYPVNFNCPGQVSVSAEAEIMPLFAEEVKAAGGRMLPLKVNGGFHSPFMTGAAEAFKKEVADKNLTVPSFKVYSDLTAKPYETAVLESEYNEKENECDAAEISCIAAETGCTASDTGCSALGTESGAKRDEMADMLSKQIVSPVLWEQLIRNMISDGADTFIEIGPGETLSGMIKRIDKNVRVFAVSDTDGIERLKKEL